MSSTDRPLWHPGIDPVGGEWPVAVPLMPDELLSSWLVRSALAQGCDPMALTGYLWPEWRAWTVDLDRSIQGSHLERLSRSAGIPVGILKQATLASAIQVLGLDPGKRGTLPWIMVVGARNRKRKTGLQFCPACLAAGPLPYYRVQWRLAWHSACPFHGTLLVDQCPGCGSPVQPHRLEADAGDAARCHRCSFDFRTAPLVPAPEPAMRFQREADLTVIRGRGSFGRKAAEPREWFGMARFMVGVIRKASSKRLGVMDRMLAALGVDIEKLESPATGLAFEMLPAGERANLLSAVWTVIESGSSAFIRAALENKATLRTLCERSMRCPSTLLEDVWNAIPGGTAQTRKRSGTSSLRPQSKSAVKRQWARLQRKWAAEDS